MSPHPLNDPRREEHEDLLALDLSLRELGGVERAHAGPGLEERLFGASRTALTPMAGEVAGVARRVDRLAAIDAAAAGPELEAQAFELSREAVASGRDAASAGPGLRLVGEGPAPAVVTRRRVAGWGVWGLRAAAAVAVVGAAVLALQRGTPGSDTGERTVAMDSRQLAETLAAEMDALFEIVETGHTETASGSGEAEPDTSWMDDLFTKESL